ncbi:hypothetical protein BC938DRAFT_483573, partial [Jimgerdemannia flammicorona]
PDAITIDKNLLVSKLRDAIKEKNSLTFNQTDARMIQLWKVDIPLDMQNDNYKKATLENSTINIDVENDLNGTNLMPVYPISFYFPDQPAAIRVHVIVKPPTPVYIAFENLITSMSVLANRIKDHRNFQYLASDLSFLEVLTNTETRQVREIYDEIVIPNSAWKKEIEEVQPWVNSMYEELAKIFQLTVNWDTR